LTALFKEDIGDIACFETRCITKCNKSESQWNQYWKWNHFTQQQ